MNRRSSQRGVALVITLIMLALVTVVALLFLGIARRNRAGVSLRAEQTSAELATAAAFERAKDDVVAQIIASGNLMGFDLTVSQGYDRPPFSGNPMRDPRGDTNGPVVVNTNRGASTGPLDSRFYLDLNRDGLYQPSFTEITTNTSGGANTIHFNRVAGDPEWIFIPDKLGQPYGPNNKFIARYAYIVMPAGKALDINSIHNTNAPVTLGVNRPRFWRNQGAGSWELNLAALFHETDPNVWTYNYNSLLGAPLISGSAFTNAHNIVSYRYNDNGSGAKVDPAAPSLQNMVAAVGTGAVVVANTVIDEYGNSPEGAADNDNANTPWAGADNPRHFFTHQELFDTNKVTLGFTRALTNALRNGPLSGYKYYDLLSQLSTDTGTENDNRINLNWVNQAGHKVGEFLSWDDTTNVFLGYPSTNSVLFFTNVAQRILDTMLDDFNPNTGTNGAFLTNVCMIMVYPTNLYSSAMHRIMQLAANIFDATRPDPLPSVFRPILGTNGLSDTNIFIIGWTNDNQVATMDAWLKDNTNGIPVVIGAKKGLPNFNEYSLRSDLLVSRKLNLIRLNTNAPTPFNIDQTNQMYVLGLSNMFAVEAWNPYNARYNRPWQIRGSNVVTVMITNDLGLLYITNYVITYGTNGANWPGWDGTSTNGGCFKVPLYSMNTVLANSAYHFRSNRFYATTNRFEDLSLLPEPFPLPYWIVTVSNQIVYSFSDTATGRMLDFVVLNDTSTVDVHRELLGNPELVGTPYGNVWNTNRSRGQNGPHDGMVAQIDISLGNTTMSLQDWNSYNAAMAGLNEKERAINGFRAFVGLGALAGTPAVVNTRTNVETPYNPVARLAHVFTWQANDPLIHYHLGDLRVYPTNSFSQILRNPKTNLAVNIPPMSLGELNNGYSPWASSERYKTADTNSFDLTMRDPGVVSPDLWDFPTNKMASIGWLGKVHRGTPWQTVYFKAQAAEGNAWERQSHDPLRRNHPTNDWKLVDIFSTALSDFSTLGLLSINQARLPAWSAALSGVVVVSNSAGPADVNLGRAPVYDTLLVQPVGVNGTNAPLFTIYDAITTARDAQPGRVFTNFSALLSIPALTTRSPYLNTNDWRLLRYGIDDFAYERIPQQILGLLRIGEPRFVIYAYGQALKPDRINPSTRQVENYRVTAEFATRTVLRLENLQRNTVTNGPTWVPDPHLHVGATNRLRAVIETFNILPPD
jgi:lipoprotein-anchoring transpeptidase ErfK/SrfK